MRARLFDISTYNTNPGKLFNFEPAGTRFGVCGFIFRSSIGVNQDLDFINYLEGSKNFPYITGTYHYDLFTDPIMKQTDLALKNYLRKPFELPLAWDLENQSQSFKANRLFAISRYRSVFSLIEPIIEKLVCWYTNLDFVNNLMAPIPEFLLKRPLWVAQYKKYDYIDNPFERLENDKPGKPNQKLNYLIWQGSADGNNIGKIAGGDSQHIDCNISMENKDKFLEILPQKFDYPPHIKARITGGMSYVNVRKTPEFAYNISHYYATGTYVNIFAEQNGFCKTDHLSNEWIHKSVIKCI